MNLEELRKMRGLTQDAWHRSVDWVALQSEPELEVELMGERGSQFFVQYKGGIPYAVVIWSGTDAEKAQRWLMGRSFKRCDHEGCGVRCGINEGYCRDHCTYCQTMKAKGETFYPSHKASYGCESGRKSHCTCDACF